MKNALILTSLLILTGCAAQPVAMHKDKPVQILTVQQDGTMVWNDRTLPEEDVIIYPDGFGGERAAVKVRVPLKPDFYRDSIRVVRESEDTATLN